MNKKDNLYEAPIWTGKPLLPYEMEVIKGGNIVDRIDLLKRGCDVIYVGRNPEAVISVDPGSSSSNTSSTIPTSSTSDQHNNTNNTNSDNNNTNRNNTENNDINRQFLVLEHNSVSRLHCILQHHQQGKWYLYDVGSTHGTFWNKKRVRPFQYIPLRLDDQFSFAHSTRTYALVSSDPKVVDIDRRRREAETKSIQKSDTLPRNTLVHGKGGIGGTRKRKRKNMDSFELDNMRDMSEKEKEEYRQMENRLNEDEDEEQYTRSRVEKEVNPESIFDEDDEYFDRTKKKRRTNNDEDDHQDEIFSSNNKSTPLSLDSMLQEQETLNQQILLLKKKLNNAHMQAQASTSQHAQTTNQTDHPQDEQEDDDDPLEQFMNQITEEDVQQKKEAEMKALTEQIQAKENRREKVNEYVKILKPSIQTQKTTKQRARELELDAISKDKFM